MFSREDIAEHIQNKFDQMAFTDYSGFTDWLEGFCERAQIDFEQQSERYPQPGANAVPEFEFEEGVEGTLRYPPDSGPLASYEEHGWMDDCDMDEYRQDPLYLMVRSKLGIGQPEVLDDIRENTLHILGRCNEPADWGEDKRGLVYGMIQSGKTASMINLIASGMTAGYNLFIVLAGDKSSLRDQSQQRVNEAFNLTNGINTAHAVHSATWREDYDGGDSYMSAFRCQDRLRRGVQYRNIIVIKKNVFLLDRLIADLEGLRNWCEQNEARGFDFSEDYKCMIIDDEADYASQDTDTQGDGSAVHGKLVSLREVSGFRNCYVAYTATPQACLSANPDDCIGYPRDFFWVLEPYMEQDGEGIWRTTSYLGAEQVFNEYDSFLVKSIERDEWPHHERDDGGKYLGVWTPTRGRHERGLQDIEKGFLEGILSEPQEIDEPDSLTTALHTHIITNGVRWYRHWRRKREGEDGLPSIDDVQDDYPYHATMIHLSRVLEHQRMCREVVMRCWKRVVDEWAGIDEHGGGPDSEISALWDDQRRRSRVLPKTPSTLSFADVLPFMRLAIEISELPIRRDDPVNNYPQYVDDYDNPVCFYLINSGHDGMKMYYSDDDAYQVRTKKSAVFIGGDILSRGLTIEGLSASYFGRSAGRETGDTVLQRGRWFGHKKNQIDLIQVFVQRQAQLVFRQISIADRELRIQMKQAIRRGLGPMQVLIRLRNSPFFASTSSSKSTFVSNDNNFSFSGDRAVLKEPNFTKRGILRNNRILKAFEKRYSDLKDEGLAHNRASMFRDVPIRGVIATLTGLDVREDAFNASPKRYAEFLKDWLEDDNFSDPPPINVAVMNNRRMRRKRFLRISKPRTEEEARANATGRLEAIIGGKGSGGRYKGDYFLDRSEEWHQSSDETPDQTRRAGDPILIVLYGIMPNYLTRSLFDDEETEEHPTGRFVSGKDVMLEEGDGWYVNHGDSEKEEEKHSVLVFTAFTPNNGPMYAIGTNDLVAAAGEIVHEEDADVEEDEL